jgi:hypothetical protein
VTNTTYDSHSSSAKPDAPTLRVLCLGNELLGDDALGSVVADQLRQFASSDVDICCTLESGLHLLDRALGVRRLVVVDTVQTGNAPPGTIYQFLDSELPTVHGGGASLRGIVRGSGSCQKTGPPRGRRSDHPRG